MKPFLKKGFQPLSITYKKYVASIKALENNQL
jgi:hypothetical protein